MRLIDADALKERAIRVSTVKLPHTFFNAVGTREIDKAPTIDAKPVKHGEIIEIIDNGKMKRVFSCCNAVCTQLTMWIEPAYCPNCGAKMDGGKET